VSKTTEGWELEGTTIYKMDPCGQMNEWSLHLNRQTCSVEEAFAVATLARAAPELLAALKEIQSQCAGHADEFSANVWRVAQEAIGNL
jgi:hypothetical protein